MMKRTTLLVLGFLALATSARALEVQVWDPQLQTLLGYGEVSGGKLNIRLLDDYNGSAVVLFAQTDEEKARGLYPTLKSRYAATLRDGQLTLQVPGNERSNTPTTLQRFVTGLKLGLSVVGTGKTLPLPNERGTPGRPDPAHKNPNR